MRTHSPRRRLWIALGTFAGLSALALLVGPFLVPVPPARATGAAQDFAFPDSEFIAVPLGDSTVTLHVQRRGDGAPPLVLLHGFAASTFSWREVIGPLSERRAVVAFDRPAFGLTERPTREEWGSADDWRTHNPYSSEAAVELTIGLLDTLGIERAVLAGNSAGGTVAMLAALQHPDRVEALVLLDPAVYGGGRGAWQRRLFATPQMERLGPLLVRRIQAWGQEFGRSAWHDPARFTDDIWAGYATPLQVAGWDRALWEYTRAARPHGLEARLGEVTLPVLVITGDDDRIVPTAESVRLAGELPNARLVVIPNCGHVPQEECPAATLAAMEEFLAGVEEGRLENRD